MIRQNVIQAITRYLLDETRHHDVVTTKIKINSNLQKGKVENHSQYKAQHQPIVYKLIFFLS